MAKDALMDYEKALELFEPALLVRLFERSFDSAPAGAPLRIRGF